jgi:pyrroline-5-carboxylate reductase
MRTYSKGGIPAGNPSKRLKTPLKYIFSLKEERMIMTLSGKKIGFIGTGKMGSALIQGLIKTNTVEPVNIYASDINDAALNSLVEEQGITPCDSNEEVVTHSDILIFAVKPQILGSVLDGIKNSVREEQLVVSIAAGVPISFIAEYLPENTKIIRVMPNITVTVGEAPSALSLGAHVSYDEAQSVRHIFDSVGKTVIVPEKLMDAVTGLSGSGPAFVFLFIEALADAGVYCGLDRNIALTLAAQTVLGSAKMLLETGTHPASLKDLVTSPAGTTIEGIRLLEENKFRASIMNAVIAAAKRSEELGDK